jgi:hypothetical protein
MAKELLMMGRKAVETCRVVIRINLEFSASVGFIHKEFVAMHGHTILKLRVEVWCADSVRKSIVSLFSKK